MDRRTFLIVVAGVPLPTAPFACFAQPSVKISRVGVLAAASRQDLMDGRIDAFLQSMRELGYFEGKNLIVEARYADGHYERLPELAAELVRLKVDVIVAVPSPAIRAAQQATKTIPIVFPSTGDPVGSGFAASLARPGSNLTGLSNANLDVSAKTLELLTTAAPKISQVAILGNPGSLNESAMLKSIQAAARNVGVAVMTVEATTPGEIEMAFAAMVQQRANAVVIAGDAFLTMQASQIAGLAIKYRLPSITQSPRYAAAGGLMSYGQNPTEGYRRAAAYVDKILKGADPGSLPIEQPTRLEFVINMKTADTLGLTIPAALLLRADAIIR